MNIKITNITNPIMVFKLVLNIEDKSYDTCGLLYVTFVSSSDEPVGWHEI